MKFLASELLKPVIRLCPRGKRTLCRLTGAGGFNDPDWQHAPRRHRVYYDKSIHAYVCLDLASWSGRWYYFQGVYYDRVNQMLIRHWLRPGDTYLDIGAASGIHTLCASHVVGDSGRVISIEPLPASREKFKANMTINAVTNVTLYEVGLSDEEGTLEIAHGGRSVSTFNDNQTHEATWKVPVHRAEDLLRDVTMPGRLLVKIDTEGMEHKIIRGLTRLLDRDGVMLSVEITDAWLKKTGSSAAELFEDMYRMGFQAFRSAVRWRALIFPTLSLEPMTAPATDRWQYDAVFVRPADLPK